MSKPILVMKFGGSSLANQEGREQAIAHIRREREAGHSVVVVVSAMGRARDPYATDTLLSLVDHTQLSGHELDLIMSVGETISAVVLSSALNSKGLAALAMTGADAGMIVSTQSGDAEITHIDPFNILNVLQHDHVAVVTGFQGVDKNGVLHTLGRGGSDTSACALGVALKAERVDIYTDVDGVFTADPRSIDSASLLKTITADELYQMARQGSRIVHTPAAELALQSGVRMRVRNTFATAPSPQIKNTHASVEREEADRGNASRGDAGMASDTQECAADTFDGTEVISMEKYRGGKVATAVTSVPNIARLRVRLPYAKDDPIKHMAAQTAIYRLMADADISIDMFTPMNDRVVFLTSEEASVKAVEILEQQGFAPATRSGLGKVSLVGSGMHGVPGVMAKVAESLQECGIDILQIADSHATISLLIDGSDLLAATKALHKAFEL